MVVGEYQGMRYEGHGHDLVAEWHMDDTVGYIQIQQFGWHGARRMALVILWAREQYSHASNIWLHRLGGCSRETRGA